jgi:hypothetical protein
MNLQNRLERLEAAAAPALESPPETPEGRRVREEYEAALALLHERTGGSADLADCVARDPSARQLAREAREKFRAFIRVTRGGQHEQ